MLLMDKFFAAVSLLFLNWFSAFLVIRQNECTRKVCVRSMVGSLKKRFSHFCQSLDITANWWVTLKLHPFAVSKLGYKPFCFCSNLLFNWLLECNFAAAIFPILRETAGLITNGPIPIAT
jgi:hypothetical protein